MNEFILCPWIPGRDRNDCSSSNPVLRVNRRPHKLKKMEPRPKGSAGHQRALEMILSFFVASKSTGDDFEEFVALLEKIQYMKTFHGNFGIWEEVSMRQDSDMKVMKSKSPWIPSFEWEDFSGFAAKDTIKRISADHFNTTYSSYDKRPAESFDLNVEASSNQKISAGF